MKKYKSVFLIDDDVITNYYNRTIVVEIGLTQNIFSANNGMEGLKLIKDHIKPNAPDDMFLVFLDINMPVMNGFEFLSELFDYELLTKHLEIIIISTTTCKNDIAKVNEYGLLGIINKPLTQSKLMEVINSKYPTLARVSRA